MPRKPIGDRPLTGAERQERLRQKRAANCDRWRTALERIANEAAAIREAREIAAKALETDSR